MTPQVKGKGCECISWVKGTRKWNANAGMSFRTKESFLEASVLEIWWPPKATLSQWLLHSCLVYWKNEAPRWHWETFKEFIIESQVGICWNRIFISVFLVSTKTQEQSQSNLARRCTFEKVLNNPNQEMLAHSGGRSSLCVYSITGWLLCVTPWVGAWPNKLTQLDNSKLEQRGRVG